MNWQEAVERTVTALGYDLVDSERAASGLLRVYIDRVAGKAYDTGVGEAITVDDCEKVTRQLQHLLEVEGCAYERLEVSSPGLDRPLKREADFERFIGENVALTLKMPFKGRKKFQGELQRCDAGADGVAQWRLVLEQAKQGKAKWQSKKQKNAAAQAASAAIAPVGAQAASVAIAPVGAASAAIPPVGAASAAIPPHGDSPLDAHLRADEVGEESRLKPLLRKDKDSAGEGDAPQLALDFSLNEVREARLVPELDFKGRRFEPAPEARPADAARALGPAPADAAQPRNKTLPAAALAAEDQEDGGRDK